MCVYVCIYVYVCVCVCVYVYMCVCMCIYECMYVCMFMYVCVCMCPVQLQLTVSLRTSHKHIRKKLLCICVSSFIYQ